MSRGSLAIVVIFGVAVCAAAFAVWYQFDQQRRSLEFWGNDTATIIRHTRHVEVLRFSKIDDKTKDSILIDGARFAIVSSRQIDAMAGLVHVRHALISDASYEWENASRDSDPKWEFGFRFTRDNFSVVIAVDSSCDKICFVGKNRTLAVAEKIAKGLKQFFNRAFELVPSDAAPIDH